MAKIVLDFDGTIFSTAKRIVDLAKIHYSESYNGGVWGDIKEYGFSPVLSLDEDILQGLFNREDFYKEEYLMDGAIKTIKKLQSKGHTVEVLSVGTVYNNLGKANLLEKVGLEIVLNLVTTVGSNRISFDKGTYFANKKLHEKAIYVDDRLQCLRTVRGFDYKIQMREQNYVLDSDKSNEFEVVTSWEELDRVINRILK